MNESPRIEQVGTEHWPRYRIVLGNAFWCGKGWDSNHAHAVIFASIKLATEEWKKVIDQHHGVHKERTLIANVIVSVRAEDGFSLMGLAQFLSANACVQLNQEPPPLVDVAITNIQIEWGRLKERESP